MATLAFSDTQLEKRNVIARAIKSVRKDALDIFEPSEEAFLYREQLGVGCWIGVKSIRHGKLFDLLAKNYFKNLDRYVCNSSDGRVWVRFGYDLNLRVRLEIEEVGCAFGAAFGKRVVVSGKRNFYRATDPRRVFDKLAEGRKRWEEMARLERSGQTEEFVHSLSAFLECFRTTANRLYGVVETESGYQTMKAVESQLNSHPQIGYLIDRAISESHGDGPVIWKRFNISVSETMQKYPSRLSSRFGDATRWVRFRSRFEPATVQTQTVVGTDWQFAGNSASLVELCRVALDEIETLVKQNISVTQPTP